MCDKKIKTSLFLKKQIVKLFGWKKIFFWENKQKAFAYSPNPKRRFQFSVLTNWVTIFKLQFFFFLIKAHSILFLKLVSKHELANKKITIMDRNIIYL